MTKRKNHSPDFKAKVALCIYLFKIFFMKQENTVTLPPRVVAFWTGGFDSTFRILQVALI
jgi:hypothetical protein